MSSQRMKDRFDQAHLVNIANGLTTARVLLVPLFAYMLIEGRFRFALLVFAACGISDMLDGLLARWLRQQTLLGFLLDPIADKAMVVIALTVLTALSQLAYWVVIPAVIIMFREIFVSGLREFLGDRASLLKVTKLAKWKTTFQMIAIATLFFATGMNYLHQMLFYSVEPSVYEQSLMTGPSDGNQIYVAFMSGHYAAWTSYVMLWLSSGLTLITGWDYLMKAMPFLREPVK